MNLETFLSDQNLLGDDFGAPSWRHWRIVLSAALGEPLSDEDACTFRTLADRDPPPGRVSELWLAVGRRGGKDSAISALATYLAVYGEWAQYLRRGEVATILCLAVDKTQSSIIFRYIRSYFEEIPLLNFMLVSANNGVIELNNGTEIVIMSSDFRRIRGRTVACGIMDEVAFWRDENFSNPDSEVYTSLINGMLTLKRAGAMLCGISTTYRKAGLFFEKVTKYLGQDDPNVLSILAPSISFNPTLAEPAEAAEIERIRLADPFRAAAEYDSEWRSDISDFVDRALIESLVIPGRRELPPAAGNGYLAFTDPAGGSGSDSMTLAIAHADADGKAILDLTREWQPRFSPQAVVDEAAQVLKYYRCDKVVGDRYGGEWPRERFRERGIGYEISELFKADIYNEAIAMLNSGRCELHDNRRTIAQICSLERKTAWGGKTTIDHPRNGHDDLANSVLGVLTLVVRRSAAFNISPEALHTIRTMPKYRRPVPRV